MPRAATAILAIACGASASYLGHDASVLTGSPLGCVSKSRRGRILSKRTGSKRSLNSQFDPTIQLEESEDEQDIFERLATWSKLSTDIEAFSELTKDAKAFPPKKKPLGPGAVSGLGALPEDLFLAALEYSGIQGRAVCRAARRSCDVLFNDGLVLPTFPVNLVVKQQYHFGPDQPVTSTWSLRIPGPSAPSFLEVCTESGSDGQENVLLRQSSQSGKQVLRLCHELRGLQRTLGVHHKESGRTQVEVVATDAKGRTLLEHAYEHRIFCSKADDLLELLTESELLVKSVRNTAGIVNDKTS